MPRDPNDQGSIPIVIRLSGHAQLNDKLAMREIGRQLVVQTGRRNELDNDEDEDREDDEDNDEIREEDQDQEEEDSEHRAIAHLSSILVSFPIL